MRKIQDLVAKAIVEELFGDITSLKKGNSVVSVILNNDDEGLVSILNVCDDETIRLMRDDEPETELVLTLEPSKTGSGQDLILRLESYTNTCNMVFEVSVSSMTPTKQRELLVALIGSNSIGLFLSNDKHIVKDLHKVVFMPNKHKRVFNEILGKEN